MNQQRLEKFKEIQGLLDFETNGRLGSTLITISDGLNWVAMNLSTYFIRRCGKINPELFKPHNCEPDPGEYYVHRISSEEISCFGTILEKELEEKFQNTYGYFTENQSERVLSI